MKNIRKSDLSITFAKQGTFLFCKVCMNHYSANRDEYFLLEDDEIIKCCDEPLTLVSGFELYRSTKLKDSVVRFYDLASGTIFGANMNCYSSSILVKCGQDQAVCIWDSMGEAKGHLIKVHPDQPIRETYSATLVDEQAPTEKNTFKTKTKKLPEGLIFSNKRS